MPLFQQSVLKKYIHDLNKTQLQAAWQMFTTHFLDPVKQANIRNLKEEEYQEGFVRELFVAVLGYTLNPQPDYNFVLEKKTMVDATKSDGAVLHNNDVIAVIELKDTGTPDLDKVSTQAFGYKNKHKHCTYVITSNFEKLRFYIADATDYEEFNLFTLTPDRFAVLYLCMHRQYLTANIPLQVKQSSLVEEENVTKKLYADYSLFKRQLFQNITAQNPQYDKLLLFKETQKLLDRFLFILFAEDRLLLPPNSVREILKQWETLKELDNYVPLYERFKKYFGYLNTGHAGKHYEIFAYNGGLFAPDEVLDNINVDDAILFNAAQTLSKYDFETDVDVNILGHIFEHSLSEIEELQAELEGKAVEKKTTKRKKDGVFYTPRYITKYIVENTVGALCSQQKEALGINEENFAPQKRKDRRKALLDTIDTYRKWLLQLTICDPACGSGAFLNAALEYLKDEHKTLDELTARIHGTPMVFSDIENEILENNLYGVDINEEAVEIAKLSLWLRTAKKGRKLSTLTNNIKCGNSLIDDAAVAGDKAFKWEEEFKAVFDKGGFDVVIGNPPYGSINNKQLKNYFKYKYESFNGNLENYCFFSEKFIKNAKQNIGKIGLIIPVTWLTIPQFQQLRRLILNYEINQIVELPTKIFQDADLDTLIITISKKEFKKTSLVSVSKVLLPTISNFETSLNSSQYLPQLQWTFNEDLKLDLGLDEKSQIVVKSIKKRFNKLSDFFEVSQGIVPYAREEFYKRMDKEQADAIVDQRLWHSDQKVNEKFKQELKGEDVSRYSITWNGKLWVMYGDWLARPRLPKFFTGPRILIREITRGIKLNAAYTEDEFYNNPGIINLIRKENNNRSLKSLLAIINSSLMFWYHLQNSPKARLQTSIPKILIGDIEDFPIPDLLEVHQQSLIEKVDIMLAKNKELTELSTQFIQFIQAKFPSLNINNKLQHWHALTAAEFLKELGKQKIKLPLAEQQEWLQYFNTQQTKAAAIRQTLQTTDTEIDAMVYALYGLTEEEIQIVEGT